MSMPRRLLACVRNAQDAAAQATYDFDQSEFESRLGETAKTLGLLTATAVCHVMPASNINLMAAFNMIRMGVSMGG
jgi:hypothetical protein